MLIQLCSCVYSGAVAMFRLLQCEHKAVTVDPRMPLGYIQWLVLFSEVKGDDAAPNTCCQFLGVFITILVLISPPYISRFSTNSAFHSILRSSVINM